MALRCNVTQLGVTIWSLFLSESVTLTNGLKSRIAQAKSRDRYCYLGSSSAPRPFERTRAPKTLAMSCNCNRLHNGAVSGDRMVMQKPILLTLVALISQGFACASVYAASEVGEYRSKGSVHDVWRHSTKSVKQSRTSQFQAGQRNVIFAQLEQ